MSYRVDRTILVALPFSLANQSCHSLVRSGLSGTPARLITPPLLRDPFVPIVPIVPFVLYVFPSSWWGGLEYSLILTCTCSTCSCCSCCSTRSGAGATGAKACTACSLSLFTVCTVYCRCGSGAQVLKCSGQGAQCSLCMIHTGMLAIYGMAWMRQACSLSVLSLFTVCTLSTVAVRCLYTVYCRCCCSLFVRSNPQKPQR
jgi:hypothetical protein